MPPRQLSDYIKVYDNTLSPERCQALMDRFESSPAQHEVVQIDVRGDGTYRFVMLNVTTHWPDVDRQVWPIMRNCVHQYYEALGLHRFWPTNASVEPIRLKRYLPNGLDRFDPHVDVLNRTNCDRFVTAILYLNVPGGGETVFPDLDISIQPEPGRLVVFPPFWTFVHAGLPPRDHSKYILHTYLLYPSPSNPTPAQPTNSN